MKTWREIVDASKAFVHQLGVKMHPFVFTDEAEFLRYVRAHGRGRIEVRVEPMAIPGSEAMLWQGYLHLILGAEDAEGRSLVHQLLIGVLGPLQGFEIERWRGRQQAARKVYELRGTLPLHTVELLEPGTDGWNPVSEAVLQSLVTRH